MKLLITFISLLCISSAQAEGGKGGSTGNGGEGGIGPEVTSIAYQLAHLLPDYPELIQSIIETKIIATDYPLQLENGVELDAINIPSQHKILINKSRWKALDCRNKYTLLLHELFGIEGTEAGQNYSVSVPIIARLAPVPNALVCLQFPVSKDSIHRLIIIPSSWSGPLMFRLKIHHNDDSLKTLPGSVSVNFIQKSETEAKFLFSVQSFIGFSFDKSIKLMDNLTQLSDGSNALHLELNGMKKNQALLLELYSVFQPSDTREILIADAKGYNSAYIYLLLDKSQ